MWHVPQKKAIAKKNQYNLKPFCHNQDHTYDRQSVLTIYRNDKGDALTASYYHLVSPLSNTAVGAELSHSFSSNENTLTIGTQHALDPLTSVKARVNNYGRASGLIQHEWRPKSLFTISGEVDTRAIEKSAKIGLALALKPQEICSSLEIIVEGNKLLHSVDTFFFTFSIFPCSNWNIGGLGL